MRARERLKVVVAQLDPGVAAEDPGIKMVVVLVEHESTLGARWSTPFLAMTGIEPWSLNSIVLRLWFPEARD